MILRLLKLYPVQMVSLYNVSEGIVLGSALARLVGIDTSILPVIYPENSIGQGQGPIVKILIPGPNPIDFSSFKLIYAEISTNQRGFSRFDYQIISVASIEAEKSFIGLGPE